MKIQRDILYLLTSILLLVLAWIGFSIYHIAITTKINQDVIEETTPINPSFNNAVIQDLKTKQLIVPLDNFGPLPTNQPVQTASSSGILTPSPTQSVLSNGNSLL